MRHPTLVDAIHERTVRVPNGRPGRVVFVSRNGQKCKVRYANGSYVTLRTDQVVVVEQAEATP